MKIKAVIGCLLGVALATAQKARDEEDENTYISYDPKRSIKSVLSEYPGDFGSDLFQELLTRKDLSHLLLSDITNLENQLLKEFPEAITLESIGQSWEKRDINVISLDARKLVNSEAFKSVP